MSPQELVVFAKRVHDQEGYNLGSGSSREYRNEFWARVVGYVHHGSTRYSIDADPRWYLKNGGPGRPQSDDVAVLLPSRQAWDFIAGVGANGYTFVLGHEFILPPEQETILPPKPTGGTVTEPPVLPPPTADLTPIINRLVDVETQLNKIVALLTGYAPALNDAKTEAFNAAVRASEIKTLVENIKIGTAPEYSGTVLLPGYLGGTRQIVLKPSKG